MIITGIELKNFGPHENLSENTDGSVVAVLGENGKGKTRVLKAIEFAFTGELDCKHSDAIRRGAVDVKGKPVTNASVIIRFRFKGDDGEIYRQIGTNPKRHLKWDGATITREKEIQEKLQEILNCDKRAISLAVFLAQGKLGEFLFLTPTERATEFSRMCLIDHLPKVGDVIEQETASVRRLITDHGAILDEVEGQLRDAEATAGLLVTRLNEHKDHSSSIQWGEGLVSATQQLEGKQSSVNVAVAAVEQAEAKLREVDLLAPEGLTAEDLDLTAAKLAGMTAAQSKAQLLDQQITTANSRVSAIEQLQSREIDQMAVALRALAVDAVVARINELKDRHTKYAVCKEATAKLKNDIAIAESALKTLEASYAEAKTTLAAVKERPELAAAAIELAKLDDRTRVLTEVLKIVGEFDGTCPFCATGEIHHAELREELAAAKLTVEKYRAANKDLANAQDRLTELESKVNSMHDIVTAKGIQLTSAIAAEAEGAVTEPDESDRLPGLAKERHELTTQLANEKARQETLANEKRQLELLAPEGVEGLQLLRDEASALAGAPGELDKVRATHSALAVWVRNRAGLAQDASNAKAILGKARSESLELETKVAQLKSVQPRDVTDLAQPTIDDAVRLLKEKQHARTLLQGEMDQATKNVRRLEARRDEIRKLMSDQQGLRELISDLERLKSLFGKDGIQKQYLRTIFESLALLTAENLSEWDADFMVREDPNQSCNFLFCRMSQPDEWMDQNQLSGGQRMRLSISFLLAVQQIIFPDLGFMVLDEPSVHMDERGVEDLGNLFTTMAERMEHTEAQVIVVDHHEGLRTSFQKVVEVV